MDHHPICPYGINTTECIVSIYERRNHLYPTVDSTGYFLSCSILWILYGTTRQEEQTALCTLLFPSHEPERLLWNLLSEKPPTRRNMGESEARLTYVLFSKNLSLFFLKNILILIFFVIFAKVLYFLEGLHIFQREFKQ